MTDSTNNSFEEQWQNAFDDTQLTPPESVWEKIELTLKPENTLPSKPNFGNRPYYFLGGIVVGLLGIFLWSNNTEKESQVVDKEEVKSNVIIKKEPIVSEGKTVERVAQDINHKAKFTPLSVSPQTTLPVLSVETQTTAKAEKIIDVAGEDTNHGAEKTTTIEETPVRTLTDSVEIITPLTTKSIHSEIENPTVILPIDQTPYYVKPIIESKKKSIFKNVKISVGAGAYQP